MREIIARGSRWLLATIAALTVLATSARADLHFGEPSANAGTVYTGTKLIHSFTFVNQGPGVVDILSARASCGCLAPRVDRYRFKPGESGEVALEVKTLSQGAGPHTWTVRLGYVAEGISYEVTLELHASMLTEVMVQPSSLVLFADKAAGHELVLTDTRAKPLTVTALEASSEKIKPRLSEPERNSDGHTVRRIRLDVANDFPEGKQDVTVVLYTDDPKYSDLRIPVTILNPARQRLAALPNEVSLTAGTGLPVPARMVLIRDNNGQTVKIEDAVADDPAITCKWAEGPRKMATLKIQVDRNQIRGSILRSAVHVQISQPIRESVIIPVTVSLP